MKPQSPHVTISVLLLNRRGIALLYLVILFTLLGVLVSAGVRMFGSKVNLGKTKDAKAEMERDVQMITAWAVRKGHWPSFREYSSSILGTMPLDTWGRPLVYVYYSSPTRSSTTELCGTTTSGMTYNGHKIAFLLLSGGDDMTINSTTPTASGAFNTALTGLVATDLFRIVTLSELQAQAGCAGSTQGSLKILNNELPSVCVGDDYNGTVFATGGVPNNGLKDNYSWSIVNRPPWMTPGYDNPTFTALTTPLQLGGTAPIIPQAYAMALVVKDGDVLPNEVRKNYSLKVSISGSCASAFAATPARFNACANSPACPAACASDPDCRTACSAPANSACAIACPTCVVVTP